VWRGFAPAIRHQAEPDSAVKYHQTPLTPSPASSQDFELTQAKAICYTLGAFSESERFQVEVEMERDAHLREETVRRLETAADSLLPEPDEAAAAGPSRAVKTQLLRSIDVLSGLESFMAQFVRTPNDCIVVTDTDSHITWANAAFSKMCGYSLDELKGKRPGQLLHGPRTSARVLRRLGKAIRLGKKRTEEVINYHKAGHPYRVRLTISPIVDTEGKACGFISVERELASKPIPR
jgi:PAS domain S-box-containing protein